MPVSSRRVQPALKASVPLLHAAAEKGASRRAALSAKPGYGRERNPVEHACLFYGIKKTGPGMMPGRLAACSLRGRKRGVLKLDDGVQAVPSYACGQRDFVLGAFLFKLGGFSVFTAVHDDGRFCEFLADVLDEERFGAFQLFSLLSNQRADMQVDGFLPRRSVL